VSLVFSACVGDSPVTPVLDAGVDTSVPDSSTVADAADAASPVDAADVSVVPPTFYSYTDPNNWEAFDLSSIAGPIDSFRCALFDGKYLYFGGGHAIVRYDPQKPFNQFGSWTTFATNDPTTQFNGPSTMIYDGQRYIYVIQYGFGYGIFARYDTQGVFDNAGSWSFYDLKQVSAAATGFLGGAFDGKYVYLINDNQIPAITYRFDTTKPAFFNVPSAYEQFDLGTTFAPSRVGIHTGGAFDGKYVYSVPIGLLPNQLPDLFVRYDTTQSFSSGTSWQSFDSANLGPPPPAGPAGAIFDGTFMYFPPGRLNQTPVVATRYDTTKAFGSANAWSTIDLKGVDPNVTAFVGGTWDGKYVYFAPNGAPGPVAARYDTAKTFTDKLAWETFDTSGKVPGPSNTGASFIGSAFDGAYMYMVTDTPNARTVLRFHARSPAALPTKGGSFL
jgi:hypothetical protein